MKLNKIVPLILTLATVLVVSSASVHALTQSNDLTVQGILLGPPPATSPTITNPQDGQTSHQKNNLFEGSCISDLIVKVYSNNVFLGSTLCSADNSYSIGVDLFEGKNDCTIIQYNSSNQASPASDAITVFFVPSNTPSLPPTTAPLSVARFDLRVAIEDLGNGECVGQEVNLPVRFVGGQQPYALNLDWGDGDSSLLSRQNTHTIVAPHVFKSGGYKIIKIKVVDIRGDKANLQFVAPVCKNTSFLPNSTQNLSDISISGGISYILFLLLLGLILGLISSYMFVKWLRHKRLH